MSESLFPLPSSLSPPQRPLGATGLSVSCISFGAGPVPGLMTGDDSTTQRAVVARALELGVNYFDTAASYGNGESERRLGRALRELVALESIHVATKVRLMPDDLGDIGGAIRRSLEGSLERLGLKRVAVLQLHNSITAVRGAQHTSLTPDDALKRGGVLDRLLALRDEGLVEHVGLTGLGEPGPLAEVIRSGGFETIQVVYNVLNPTAARPAPPGWNETDYGQVIAVAAEQRMGIVAMRILAGGALAERPPSAHTLSTKFFPIDLYERDRAGAARLAAALPAGTRIPEISIRFALGEPRVATALVGMAEIAEVEAAAVAAQNGPLDESTTAAIESSTLLA